ncbi:hypothetical protein QPP83_002190 [Vibrio parahaemolyticus]|nr:hypothetical protein [Vibrio parahaemolyticus]
MSRKKNTRKNNTNKYLRIVRSSKNRPKLIIKRVFADLDGQEIRKYSRQIYDDPIFSKLLLKIQPESSVFYRGIITDLDLASTLRWVEIILINQKEKIEEYINLEKKITSLILIEDFNSVIPELSEFSEKHGESFVITQIYAYIYSKVLGVEASKDFVSGLKSEKNKNIYNFILEFLNSRSDNANTYTLRTNELNSKLEEAFSDDVGFMSFLKYKVLPVEFHQDLCLKTILNYEMNSSVIDLYKAYIYVCSLAIYKNNDTKLEFLESIKFVRRKIEDIRLINHSFSLGNIEEMDSLIDSENIKCIDLYTSGKYQETCNYFESDNKIFHSFNFFEIYTRSLIRSENYHPKINSSYLDETINIIIKNGKSNANKILNQSFSLNCLDWFLDQHIFCYTNNKESNSGTYKFFKSLYFIRSDIFSAFKCNSLDKKETNIVLEKLREITPESSSLELYELYTSEDNKKNEIECLDISEERKIKYTALHFYSIGDYSNSLEYFYLMYKSNDEINRMESINGLISCLLQLEKIEDAAKFACEILVLKEINGINLPLDDICRSIKKVVNKQASIYFPICLYLHGKLHDDRFHNTLKLSFEKYLLSQKVVDFRLIIEKESRLEEELVYYFLENIFVPNVMKGPLLFSNAIEIENTRIELCLFLLEKEKGNKESIQKEIKERSKKLVLKDLKNHIDSNKIYVDIDYIKDKIQDECRYIYSNYLNSVKDKNKNEYRKVNQAIETIKKQEDLLDIHTYVAIRGVHLENVTLSEHSKLLHSIVRKIRDEFTKGIKGLSGYLSTRIKHGTLEKHLLKAFKENEPRVLNPYNLIKISEAENYTYMWSERFSYIDENKAKKLDKAIINFSEEFKNILFSKVINDWLQVTQYDLDFMHLAKKSERPLFNYSINNLTLVELENKIDANTSFENLWEVIIDWLWVITDKFLEDAQSRFNLELCNEFKVICENLTSKIYEIKLEDKNLNEELLTEVARSKLALQNKVRESSKWFSRNTQDMSKPIDIELVVEVVTLSLGIKIESHLDKGLTIEGKYLTYYIDIIYNLLSNSINYSYLEQEDLNINLTITGTDKCIFIEVKNNCVYNPDYIDDNSSVKLYENIYDNEKNLDKLGDQGKSGYFKIQKIIKEDLSKSYSCTLRYNSPSEFQSILEIKE